MITAQQVTEHFNTLSGMPWKVTVTDRKGIEVSLKDSFNVIASTLRKEHKSGNTIYFIGNGGSAAIASHMAIDYQKNGGLRSAAFNDASSLTCLTNDLGYDKVFSHPIDMHAEDGDTLIAISSSGYSANICSAASIARRKGCNIYTLSGFDEKNKLRAMGDINFYVPSMKYGFVEVTHLAILHAILDLMMEDK